MKLFIHQIPSDVLTGASRAVRAGILITLMKQRILSPNKGRRLLVHCIFPFQNTYHSHSLTLSPFLLALLWYAGSSNPSDNELLCQ